MNRRTYEKIHRLAQRAKEVQADMIFGMGDTIGKYFECHFAARGDQLTHRSALGREISNMCYAPLLEYGEQVLADCGNLR